MSIPHDGRRERPAATTTRSATAAVLACLAMSASAPANSEESHTVPFTIGGTPEAAVVWIPPFDGRGGSRTLRSVLFKIEAGYEAGISFENTMDVGVTNWRVELGGRLAFSSEGASSDHVFNRTLASGPRLAPSDGTPGGGRDFVDLGPTRVTVVLNGAASSVEPFLGDRPIRVHVTTDPAIGVYPTSALLDVHLDDFVIDGMLMVIYGYDHTGGPDPACPADLDGNGLIDYRDLLEILRAWGVCPVSTPKCVADLDGDGEVGGRDLVQVLAGWGTCD
ncbi:MAG: choice-of-anchor E domain-containing protein [Phycisphaerales bacterium]|nr:choice-of-anchor E domain-containing protein [Phycisphaerae bacterium]NNF43536.1 choice-of-anchor E domain-containing protein [Phycisphaerales bacterium]NNM25033.1 choice-of-anchor E domain-containing protein [Phycisphaerales bacterium]